MCIRDSPHNAIRPDSIAPPTATDLLERVLARDDSPFSATTLARQAADPGTQLGQATTRYPCLLYTSDAADERSSVDLGGRRIIQKKKTHTQHTPR